MALIERKPKVFLSHSKKDIEFIEKIMGDLRRCKIIPWFDEHEIDHGKSWLDQIFRDGLPQCDVVLAYLTENSLSSKVARREIDAGVIRELNDKNISFIGYVSSSKVRAKLRSDLATLHIPVWNDANYNERLPEVVAAIWQNFSRFVVNDAIAVEKNKRLEAEIELKELKNSTDDNVFSVAEINDFKFIHNKLNRYHRAKFAIFKSPNQRHNEIEKRVTVDINLISILIRSTELNHGSFGTHGIIDRIIQGDYSVTIAHHLNIDYHLVRGSAGEQINEELLTYALIDKTKKERDPNMVGVVIQRMEKIYQYNKKMYRFRYWLEYNDLLPDESDFKIVEE